MNITVYLSSKSDLSDNFTNAVSAIGKGIGEMNARLIYGGSNAGQMHILAATAKQHGATAWCDSGSVPAAVGSRCRRDDIHSRPQRAQSAHD